MILPYVYKLTHKISNHFYIGYRCKNVSLGLIPCEDIGVVYFTSSRLITSSNIDQYNIEIISTFINSNDAYDYEQELIRLNWDNELLINDHYHAAGVGRWKNSGHTKETRTKISASRKGHKRSLASCQKQSKSTMGRTFSDETKKKLSDGKLGDKNPMFGKEPANKLHRTEEELKEFMKEYNRLSYLRRKARKLTT